MTGKIPENINILAVCTGNICRSPMAEGILRRMFDKDSRTRISSAGTHALTGNPAAEFSVIAAFENGVDISGHRARMLDAEIIRDSHIILCMESAHVEWVLSLAPSVYGVVYNLAEFADKGIRLINIPDPYGCSLREYRECFKDINMCLRNFIGKLPASLSIKTEEENQ